MSDLLDIKAPEIKIMIDGKECKLEYDNNALFKVESELGKTISKVKENLFDGNLFLLDQIKLLYAGLLKHNPEFKEEDLKNNPKIVAILTENSLDILKAFLYPCLQPKIYNNLFIEVKEPEKKLEKKAKDADGQKSTQ